MTTEKAIKTLNEELRHIRHHLGETGKDPEYYAELRRLATAMEKGIAALKRQLEGD